jgi:HD-like signal output (HDOD) protein
MSSDLSLLDRIKQLIASGSMDLPVFSAAAAKLQTLMASGEANVDEVENLILADQVLAAEVLRAANSAFFGGLTRIQTIRNAIVRLGMKQVARLVTLASHRSGYAAKDPDLTKKLQALWRHASATAMGAHWLANRLGFANLEEEAFLGGLLHDVGKLVILRSIDELKHADQGQVDFSPELVDEVLQTAHPELGFNLLKRWDIPDIYCAIARDHNLDEFEPSNISLTTVRLANQASAKMGLSLKSDPSLVLSALPEAQALGAGEILLAELEIMLEDSGHS